MRETVRSMLYLVQLTPDVSFDPMETWRTSARREKSPQRRVEDSVSSGAVL
jgi:hypothetical protein